jgi:succinate dehydrogenase / fumarate reductase cytochrome b subunit
VKPLARPVFLNPLRIRLPLPGWVSILHRVSGVLLFVALPFAVWGLSASLSGEDGFRTMAGMAAHPLAKLLVLLLVWVFSHHVFAGLRHLALDMHLGVDLGAARLSGLMVLLGAGLVTLAAGWRLFA